MFLNKRHKNAEHVYHRYSQLSTRSFAKYCINHDFLDNGLISHKHAWFWGLFLTDGSIHCPHANGTPRGLIWSQKYDSYPMLETLRSVCGSTHPMIFGTRTDGISLYCLLSLYSSKLACTAQQMLGCVAYRKTFDLVFPEMEEQYLPSIIRGIFEGDGSWVINRVAPYAYMRFSITSASFNFLRTIQRVINEHGLNTIQNTGKIYSHGKHYELLYTRQ
eukprot:812766_1